jgi:hypothetical protein
MMPDGNQPDLQQRLEQLSTDLQDAHLVIGQQQVMLLRLNMMASQMQARLAELEGVPNGIPEPTVVD